MIDGCFNAVTSRVKVLGWLEKKERKKEEEEEEEEEDEQFWISTVSGRPP